MAKIKFAKGIKILPIVMVIAVIISYCSSDKVVEAQEGYFEVPGEDMVIMEKKKFLDIAVESKDEKVAEKVLTYLDDPLPVIRWKAYIALALGKPEHIKVVEKGLAKEGEDFWNMLIMSIKDLTPVLTEEIITDIVAIGPPIKKYIKQIVSDHKSDSVQRVMQRVLRELDK